MKPLRLILLVTAALLTIFGGSRLLAGLTEGTPAAAADDDQDFGVDIWGAKQGLPMVRKDPIATPLFLNMGTEPDKLGLTQKLSDQVADDMRMTGRFEVIDRALYVENPHTAGIKMNQFNFKDWSDIGAEYLIKGGFKFEGETLTVELRLFHVPTKKMLVGKGYTGKPEDWYVMVHKFGNDVVYELTREKGIFGTKIAFVSAPVYGGETQELYVVDVDGRNLKRLTFLNGKAKNPTWSPDGTQLVFAWENSANTTDPYNYLYAIPAEGGKPKLIFGVKGLVVTPRFSPSGSRIALAVSLEGNMEIYTIPAAGGQLKRLTVSAAIELFPAWSPDGSQLAFVSDRTGSPQIWKMNSDGSEPKRVSYFGTYNQAPDWARSPTGEKIVYSSRESGGFHILMMNADGTDTTVITQGQGFASCEYPAFSPDGRAIAMTTNAGNGRQLQIFNVDGSFTKQLTKVGADDTNPSWSPRLLN
jgi:TolB protein